MIEVCKSFETIYGPPIINVGVIKIGDLTCYDGRPLQLKEDNFNVVNNMMGCVDKVYENVKIDVENREYSLVTQIKPLDSDLISDNVDRHLQDLQKGSFKGGIEKAIEILTRGGGNHVRVNVLGNDGVYVFDYKILEENFNTPSIRDYLINTKEFLFELRRDFKRNININREDDSLTISLKMENLQPFYVS